MNSGLNVALGWAVHLFTATGAVCGLLALDSIAASNPLGAFAWMFAAVVIDAIDGYAARAVDVQGATPSYDGALLDNLVDYLNYAVVPAFFLLRFDIVERSLAPPAAAAVVLAAAYQFARRDAKTADHFFRGFPSYWNVVVFYLYFLELGAAAVAVIGVLVVASFVPTRWAYPTRMPYLRSLTLALAAFWGAALAYAVWMSYRGEPAGAVVEISLLFVAYYVGVSIYVARRTSATA